MFALRLLLLLETQWRGFALNAPPQLFSQQVPGPGSNPESTMSVKKMNAEMRRLSKTQGDIAAIDAAPIVPEARAEQATAPTPTEPAAADATVAQGTKKKKTEKKAKSRRRIQMNALDSGDPRVVRVEVVLTADSGEVKSTTCTIIGLSSSGASLAYKRATDGVTCVFIASERILPRGTRGLVERADSKRSQKKIPSGTSVESLTFSDFQSCTLSGVEGFVCIKPGPFFRVTCDAQMKETLTSSVAFWKKPSGKNFKFRTFSEPLFLSSPPRYLPLENAKRLDVERTFGEDVTHTDLFNILLKPSVRRPFGNRVVTYCTSPDLTIGLMGAVAHSEERFRDALKLTRDVLGSNFTTSGLGSFVVCANQTSLPWGTAERCCCHVTNSGGAVKIDVRKRCLEALARSAKEGSAPLKRARAHDHGESTGADAKKKKKMCTIFF